MTVLLRTGRQKWAAVGWLSIHRPELLADLRMFAEYFGPMETVSIDLDENEADLTAIVCAAQREDAG